MKVKGQLCEVSSLLLYLFGPWWFELKLPGFQRMRLYLLSHLRALFPALSHAFPGRHFLTLPAFLSVTSSLLRRCKALDTLWEQATVVCLPHETERALGTEEEFSNW